MRRDEEVFWTAGKQVTMICAIALLAVLVATIIVDPDKRYEVETVEEVNITNDTFVEYNQSIDYNITDGSLVEVTFNFEVIEANETIHMSLDPLGIKRVPKE